jgi:HAE1 family hydrophobic/amphiphilic exporter-1
VTSAEWSRSYVPTDRPTFNIDAVNLEDAMKSAMDNRFELRRLKLATDINEVDVRYFKNQTKPQIDLNTTLSFDGLSLGGANTNSVFVRQFTGNDAILLNALNPLLTTPIPNPLIEIPGTPSYLAGGFNRSIANTFRTDSPNFSVGVTISFPFRNRTAKANLAGAEIQRTQIATQTRQQEQIVIVEVRNSV